jgi:hypothetical protein
VAYGIVTQPLVDKGHEEMPVFSVHLHLHFRRLMFKCASPLPLNRQLDVILEKLKEKEKLKSH